MEEREQQEEQEGKEHIGILVFGAVFVDIRGYPFSLYRADGRNAGKVVKVHGGVSRNIVEDIANLELRPNYISVVDEDEIGEEVIRKLNRHKVNTRFIKRLPRGLGTWLALFDTEGELVGSISQRPDLSALEEVIEEQGDYLFSHCDSVIVEIDMETKLLNPIFALAEKYKKKIYAAVSNMSIALERRDLLKTTACIVCIQQEAGMLFSEEFEEMDLEEKASSPVFSRGKGAVSANDYDLGSERGDLCGAKRQSWLLKGKKGACFGYRRSRRCLFCRSGNGTKLWEKSGRGV